MRRLNLDDFKLKNLEKTNEKSTDKLLGQVLGDCHYGPGPSDVGSSSTGDLADVPSKAGDSSMIQ